MAMERILGTETGKSAFEKTDRNVVALDASLTADKLDLATHKAESMSHFGMPGTPDLVNKKIEIVAGAIRQNSIDRTKWDFISDTNHIPIGISGSHAVALGSEIVIPFSKAYGKVISFICTPDETLANRHNLSIGASVGLNSATLKASVTTDGGHFIRWDGSKWVVSTGVQNINPQVTYSNGLLTITHDYCPGFNFSLVPYSRDGVYVPYMPITVGSTSVTNSSIVVGFIDVVTGTRVTSATPNTSMSFWLSKSYSEGIPLDGTGDSDDLNLDAGNIWFYGIFEV